MILDGTFKVTTQKLVLICVALAGIHWDNGWMGTCIPLIFALCNRENTEAYQHAIECITDYIRDQFHVTGWYDRVSHCYIDGHGGSLSACTEWFQYARIIRCLQHIRKNCVKRVPPRMLRQIGRASCRERV